MKGRLLRDISLDDWFDMEARDFDRDFDRLQREQERMEAERGPWFSDDCLTWPSEPWGGDAA